MGQEPCFPHRGPAAIKSFKGKQWGSFGQDRVSGQVPFQGMVGTICTLGVCEQEPFSKGLCLGAWKPALPVLSIAHGHTKNDTVPCDMQQGVEGTIEE